MVVDRALIKGGVDASAHRVTVQDLDVVTHLVAQSRLFNHPGELPGGDRDAQFSRSFPVAFNAVASHGRFDLVEVLPRQALDDRHLFGESIHPVGEAVGEGGTAEPPIATGGARSRLELFQHDDLAVGVALFGEQRRPQARVARADHAQVRAEFANQCRVGFGLEGVRVEPPQFGLDLGEVA